MEAALAANVARPAQYARYPNPAADVVQLSGPLPVLNPLSQVVRTVETLRQPTLSPDGLGAVGLLLVRRHRANGTVEQHKAVLQ